MHIRKSTNQNVLTDKLGNGGTFISNLGSAGLKKLESTTKFEGSDKMHDI